MPCSDGGVPYPPSPAEVARDKFARRAEPLLCAACRSLEALHFDFDTNPELSEFWATHKREDTLREEAEAKQEFRRRQAIAASKKPVGRLTKEELKLLKEFKYL